MKTSFNVFFATIYVCLPVYAKISAEALMAENAERPPDFTRVPKGGLVVSVTLALVAVFCFHRAKKAVTSGAKMRFLVIGLLLAALAVIFGFWSLTKYYYSMNTVT